ncbi:A/B/D/E cyclin [Basidiobolus meristosporus CBS 931.73]|uniref:A/B/D/E cyclin n=1 Tax=Basidiobolus meristosporus CBS 931.73 TaxID=1314790 RepID=A0A1Y1XYQ4_9FUNG|nr:A/B/D/E cyclin [Basidiobolus meristosporus CBS 931.73]|eukprot:ORX90880.1 A/B/D/E cyclin [Basidiobolus meristosporus CBS 931.73]
MFAQTRARSSINVRKSVTNDENSAVPTKPGNTKLPLGAKTHKNIPQVNPGGLKAKLVSKNEGLGRRRHALGDVSNVAPQVNAGVKKLGKPAVSKVKTEIKSTGLRVKKRTVATAPVAKAVEEPKEVQEMEIDQPEIKQDWDDLDAEDEYDPLMVSEYVQEIFEYLKEIEPQFIPNPNYMEMQKGLAWKMRAILVDWLIEVHEKFRLLPETLFLGINLIDRFLSLRVVSLNKLQLVGITAMLIASKYEEIFAPSIENFIYMADGGYSEDEVKKAERYMLQVIEWNMSYPNPLNFLRRVSKADSYDAQTRTIAKYLMEVALMDHRLLHCPPSLTAASAIYLARLMLKRGSWDANLTHYSGYSEEQMEECCKLILDYLSKPTKYQSLYNKYNQEKYLQVSKFVQHWVAKNTKSN